MIERADRAPRVLGLHFAIAGAAHSDDGDAASGGDGAVCVAGCSFDASTSGAARSLTRNACLARRRPAVTAE